MIVLATGTSRPIAQRVLPIISDPAVQPSATRQGRAPLTVYVRTLACVPVTRATTGSTVALSVLALGTECATRLARAGVSSPRFEATGSGQRATGALPATGELPCQSEGWRA